MQLYKPLCRLVGPSVGWLIGPSIYLSVGPSIVLSVGPLAADYEEHAIYGNRPYLVISVAFLAALGFCGGPLG